MIAEQTNNWWWRRSLVPWIKIAYSWCLACFTTISYRHQSTQATHPSLFNIKRFPKVIFGIFCNSNTKEENLEAIIWMLDFAGYMVKSPINKSNNNMILRGYLVLKLPIPLIFPCFLLFGWISVNCGQMLVEYSPVHRLQLDSQEIRQTYIIIIQTLRLFAFINIQTVFVNCTSCQNIHWNCIQVWVCGKFMHAKFFSQPSLQNHITGSLWKKCVMLIVFTDIHKIREIL